MRFDYLEPTTIEEAVSLLKKYDGRAKVLAGGTDLVRDKTIRPEYVVDLGNISGLDYINYDSKLGLNIGTLTTIRALEKSPEVQTRFPILSKAAGVLGTVAIRNVGTIGGNLCHAAPSADTAPALIGLSARAKIIGPKGERVIPFEQFFTGPGATVLKNDELLVEIQVPPSEPHTKGTYLKYGTKGVGGLAMVGVAVVATCDLETGLCKEVKIVLGAVAPTPMRARKAEEILRGKKVTDVLIDSSAELAASEARPISDVRASAEYRREIVRVFARRALREATA